MKYKLNVNENKYFNLIKKRTRCLSVVALKTKAKSANWMLSPWKLTIAQVFYWSISN